MAASGSDCSFIVESSSGPRTYLSPRVKSLLEVFNTGIVVPPTSADDPSHGLEWTGILSQLRDQPERTEQWFRRGALAFHCFCKTAGREGQELAGDTEWMSEPEALADLTASEANPLGDETLESLLRLTSVLERSIGDLFATVSPSPVPVPALLRDLVTSPEVTETLGPDPSTLLECLFGSPRSLNLRNLAWHGFLLPGELDPAAIGGLLALAGMIGRRLRDIGLTVNHRALRPPLKDLPLPDLSGELDFGAWAAPARRPTLIRCQVLLREERYLSATTLLLPELEALLRQMYTVANACPARVLTAESDRLYLTLSEILARDTDQGESNRLIEVLGVPLVEFLYDLFVLPAGPRVRDRVSHGEVSVGEEGRGRNWCLAVGLAYQAALEIARGLTPTAMKALEHRTSSQFHPSALLAKEIRAALDARAGMASAAGTVASRHGGELEIDPGDVAFGTACPQASSIVARLSSTRWATLFRPKSEYAALSLLRRLAGQAEGISRQASGVLEAKLAGFPGLSRRQLGSLRKMLSALPEVDAFLLEALSLAARGPGMRRREELEELLRVSEKLGLAAGRNDWDKARGLAEEGRLKAGKLIKTVRGNSS